MNKKIILNLLIFILITGCTKSYFNDMDKVDDEGRKTSIVITNIPDISQHVVTEKTILIKGSAYDRGGIKRIELIHNHHKIIVAQGTTKWKINLDLNLGNNVIIPRVINSKGKSIDGDPVYIQCSWKKMGELKNPLAYASLAQLNNEFYVIGGWVFNYSFLPAVDSIFRFNFNTNTSQAYIPNLGSLDASFSSISVIYQDHIYIIGGLKMKSGLGKARCSRILKMNKTGIKSKTDINNQSYQRGGSAYTLFNDSGRDKVFILGGNDLNGNPTSTILTYELGASHWEIKTPLLPEKIAFPGFIRHHNFIYLFGGQTFNEVTKKYEALNKIYKIDLTDLDNGITLLDSRIKYKRFGLTAVKKNNKVYLIGGVTYNSSGEEKTIDNVEIFYLDKDEVYEVKKMPYPLAFSSGILYNGNILLFGGINDDGFYTKKEILGYAPEEGIWD